MRWIKDEEINKTDSPMTKYHVRVLSMALMDLEEGMSFLDIGSGTGSISLQASKENLEVYAIDKEEKAINSLLENSKRLNLKVNAKVGRAPEDLTIREYDRIFVGGTGGNLKDIDDFIDKNLKAEGLVMGNFIIMKNAMEFKTYLKEKEFSVEVRCINHSMEDRLGMSRADNPVILVRGERK